MTASSARLVLAIATMLLKRSISGSFVNCGAPPDSEMTVATRTAPRAARRAARRRTRRPSRAGPRVVARLGDGVEDGQAHDRADPDLGDVVGALDPGLVAVEQERCAGPDDVGEHVVGRAQEEQAHDPGQLAQREGVPFPQEMDDDDVRLAQVEAKGGQRPDEDEVPGDRGHLADDPEVPEDPDDDEAHDEEPHAHGGVQPWRPRPASRSRARVVSGCRCRRSGGFGHACSSTGASRAVSVARAYPCLRPPESPMPGIQRAAPIGAALRDRGRRHGVGRPPAAQRQR